ncbi:helix-turn-helix domain-containing protein [Streptomyces sp. NPDC048385]|uniref:PucR family transcriptional regulator n=1 Tax=Streptomyces sp. NPDC048385 TaxID=3155145 RepID=UPI0034229CB0
MPPQQDDPHTLGPDAAPHPLTAVASRLADLSAAVTDRIRAEIPGYAAVPYAQHHRDVRTQMEYIIKGLVARQPPSAAAIDHARAFGRRRATQRMAVADVIEAYHVAYRELWNELLLETHNRDELALALVGEVGLLWNWFHRLSAVVAEAHAEESRSRQATQQALRRQLLEVLAGSSLSQDKQESLARSLGFEPAGDFLVACLDGVAQAQVEPVNQALGTFGGVAHCCYDKGSAVVVAQGCAEADLLAAVHRGEPTALAGVGLARSGVAGAVLSFADATQALERAREVREDVRFTDEWLMVTLGGAGQRLDALFADGAETARKHPRLAETVRAYAAHGYSLTACARALRIHPNSAKYRLDRWRELTGWDVQTFDGLVSSVVCLERRRDVRD